MAASLASNGYVVIDVAWMTAAKRQSIRDVIDHQVANFREFQSVPEGGKYVLGGFGAFGNPSAFHNRAVRILREWALVEVLPFLRVEAGPGQRLEQLVDRLMIRTAADSACKESWHRDEAPLAEATDKTFGGWWNLDDQSQYFSCVTGSHATARGHSGFGKLTGTYVGTRVEIPPGAIIVFYEHIIHEVVAKKAGYRMYRLFLGWRLTDATTPMIPDTLHRLEYQAVMPLKSNQIPPMYPVLIWTNHRAKLDAFSKHLRRRCREARRVESGAHKGETHDVVHRHMRSLYEYKLRRYKAYSARERRLYTPHRTWKVRARGSDALITVSL